MMSQPEDSATENVAKETKNVVENEAKSSKTAKDRKSRKEKVKPLAKVVIRRLPPTMSEEDFLKQIEPIPEHDYFYFVPADWSLGQHATCRAYINFRNQNDIFIFKDKFDGYVFVDARGTEYPAIVEFASFQGLPKGKSRKKDNKANSIETEQHFQSFLETLKEDENENKGELKMEYSFQLKDDEKITSTPLLEYIANVKQERRDERKRKIEDRKRVREEERQRKKNSVAKSIPKAIEEDSKENDDGIIVRTVKSRPLERDRQKKDAKQSGDGEKSSRNEKREKKRNRENRGSRRKDDRDEKSTRTVQSDDATAPKDAIDDKDKERTKRSNESRRERRARAEQNRKASQKDGDEKMSVEKAPTNKQSSSTVGASKEETKTKTDTEVNEKKKDRSIQNIRNKDRPSIQIYQPSKRRESIGDSKGSESQQEQDSTPQNVDAKKDKPAVDKKVSRYSERRNRAREKRSQGDEVTTEPIDKPFDSKSEIVSNE